MSRIHREIVRRARRHVPGAEFVIVRERKHVVVQVTWQGRSVNVVYAKTPKNSDHCVWNTVTEICKAFGVSQLNLPQP